MPCHYDEYYDGKTQFKTAVEIVNGKIKVYTPSSNRFGGGDFPNTKMYLAECKKRFKTFHYKDDGNVVVVISPCPKGC